MSDKVCSEFFGRFAAYRKDSTNEERVAFMFTHPNIRLKLDEWIEDGKSESPHGPGRKKQKTNMSNQLREDKGDKDFIEFCQSPKDKYLKNSIQSSVHKESGNSLFKDRKLLQSLTSYNQAIVFAPFPALKLKTELVDKQQNANTLLDEQELLSLSLANRSAVYFELGEKFYDKALEDMDLALEYGYPERLRKKLLLRKANICVRRKEWDLAEAIITDVGGESNHLSPDLLLKIKELKNIMAADKKRTKQESVGKVKSRITKGKLMGNLKFENASPSVEISYSDASTRSVKSVTDLKKGDVIFQEEPFASVLLPAYYESHCHHCHRIFENEHFFPCRRCTQAKFCSEKCSKSAWNLYHKEECLSLDFLHSVGIAHLAIRVTLCAGIHNVLKAVEKEEFLKDPKNVSVFSEGCSTYERVFSLLDHLADMHLEDVFQYTLTASLLTNWLFKKTSFFSGLTVNNQAKVGGAMLRHICQLICNAHAITDVLCDIDMEKVSLSTSDESQLRIASAIFPAASLMNHSCEPNIAFGFTNGKTLTVKVVQDLEAGEEVFNCYGPHFRRMNRMARQAVLLEQYFFDCICRSCVAETDSIAFVDTFSSFKCDKCEGPVIPPDPDSVREQFSGTCRDCGNSQDLLDFMKACMYTDRLFQDGEILLEKGNVDQALKIFQTCQNQRKRILYQFHSDLGQICDLIGRCYAIKGEFREAVDCVRESLTYVEKRFGSESIEYGREMKKCADLLMKIDEDKHNHEIRKLSQRYKSILSFY